METESEGMMNLDTQVLMGTELPLSGRRQGKVRDVYEAELADGTQAVVIVATDRISAFDVVMANGIAGKGVVLTRLSRFWFEMIRDRMGDRMGDHLISTDPARVPGLSEDERGMLKGRLMIGRKTRVVPIECVARGYLAGSGWKEYQRTGSICGVKLPGGLRQCEKLAEPIFTPATKATRGHDENISFDRACSIAGRTVMTKLRDWTLAVYRMAHDHAAAHGIVLADTKLEFGFPPGSEDVEPILVDEVLTPDSSRFWPAERYEPGRDQESFDKQYVRDYLQALVDNNRWDKTSPGPTLPREVVGNTMAKYLQAYRLLTGEELRV